MSVLAVRFVWMLINGFSRFERFVQISQAWAILGFEGGVSWDTGVPVCLHACWIFFTLPCPLLYLYIFLAFNV